MSERKVLNKYYPPDFDPSKIPRLRLPKDRQYTVRLMAPCNMRCTTCGEYIYKGKKFNSRKETVQNEEYLGIKVFRFYIKCPRCLAEITFKTDPENADYIVEHGATRNFQALKLAEEAAEKEAKSKEEEEKNNPMKLLENRTKASKFEMESLEALEEIKDLNQRHARVDFDSMLAQNRMKMLEDKQRQEDEDEAFIKSIFMTLEGERIRRMYEDPNTTVNKYVGRLSNPTDILCEDSASYSNPAKKQKVECSASSSRQRSLESLKKAIKVKKPESTESVAQNQLSSSTSTDGSVSIKMADGPCSNISTKSLNEPSSSISTKLTDEPSSSISTKATDQPSSSSCVTGGLGSLLNYSDTDSD